jgi:glycosyltransferase involved in cell wall biosynthesis
MEARGTPFSVYQRLLALSALGFEVDLLTYHVGEDVDISGVTIRRIPAIPFIDHVRIGPSLSKLLLDPLLMLYAIVMLMRKRYDVVHTHEEAAYFAAPLAKLLGRKHLYDMHSSLPVQLRSYRHWNNRVVVGMAKMLEGMAIRFSDVIITVAPDLHEFVKERGVGAKTLLIENLPLQSTVVGLDMQQIEHIKRDLRLNATHTIVYTGSFAPYQGLDMLIRSAEIIVGEYADIRFLLVGGSRDQIATYEQIVAARNVSDYFRFTGTVSTAEAIGYLDVATLIVSPRLEGNSTPLKVYTYLLSGKPLVATDTSAHRSVLSEDLAMLVAPNAEDLAHGILQLVNDPEQGADLACKAKEFAQDNYGFEAYLKLVELAYDHLENDRTRELQADALY